MMKMGISTLKDVAIPAGTAGGILILILSILIRAENSSVTSTAMIIPMNSPCAPRVVPARPAVDCSPRVTDWGTTEI